MADVEKIIINGVLRSAFVGTNEDEKTHEKTSNNVISIEAGATLEDGKAVFKLLDKIYEHTADKWIPKWYKDRSHITLKSAYNIKFNILDTNAEGYDSLPEDTKGRKVLDFRQFVDRGFIRGAEVSILCNVKDSALYPQAVKIIKDGEEYDPFADF